MGHEGALEELILVLSNGGATRAPGRPRYYDSSRVEEESRLKEPEGRVSEVCRLSIHKHRAGEGVEGGMEKALRRGEKGERERKMEGLQRRKAGCISVFRVVVGEEVGALWSGRGRGRLVPSPRRRTRPPISEKRHRGPLLQGYFVPAHLRERGTVCFTSMLGIIAGESSWMNTRRLRCVVTLIEKK